MDAQSSSTCTLYLMLFISIILVAVDTLEVYHLVIAWGGEMKIQGPLFETCLKWELMTRTSFCIFSLASAISAMILTFLLTSNPDYFIEKLLSTYLYFNYLVFGPILLGFCLLGIMNWGNVMYSCDRKNIGNKILNVTNIFSIFCAFLLGIGVTVLISVYKTVNLYIDSTARKPEGSDLLRKVFWWAVLKKRNANELMRRDERSETNNNQQQNTLNNNDIGRNILNI